MSDDVMVENRTFAEIEVGDTASLSRTLTKTELEGFAAVSGDFNPTHLNEAYARAHGLKAPVAHGMWTASLISNLLGNKLPGAGRLPRPGPALPRPCLPGRHGHRDGHGRRQGGGRPHGPPRLPLHQPGGAGRSRASPR